MKIKVLLVFLCLFGCKQTTFDNSKIDIEKITQCFQPVDKPILPSPVKTMDDIASVILLQKQYIVNLETSSQQAQECVKSGVEVFNKKN